MSSYGAKHLVYILILTRVAIALTRDRDVRTCRQRSA